MPHDLAPAARHPDRMVLPKAGRGVAAAPSAAVPTAGMAAREGAVPIGTGPAVRLA